MSKLKSLVAGLVALWAVEGANAQKVFKHIDQTANELTVTMYASANNGITGSKSLASGTNLREEPVGYIPSTGIIYPSRKNVTPWVNPANPAPQTIGSTTINHIDGQSIWFTLQSDPTLPPIQYLDIPITLETYNGDTDADSDREIAIQRLTISKTLLDWSPVPNWTRISTPSRDISWQDSNWDTGSMFPVNVWFEMVWGTRTLRNTNPLWTPYIIPDDITTLSVWDILPLQVPTIAPNPTSWELNITTADIGESLEIEVYSTLWQKIKSTTLSSWSSSNVLWDIQNGMYILHITNDKWVITSHKIIKE